MTHEQDYRVLAQFLVQTHGDGALDYARQFSEESPDRKGEAGEMWLSVGRAIEQLMARNGQRRKSDLAAH